MNNMLGMLGNNKILMQAFGAMMRGENPKQFMTNLAKTTPELQGFDFNNMEQVADQVCNEHGVDKSSKVNEIKSLFFK